MIRTVKIDAQEPVVIDAHTRDHTINTYLCRDGHIYEGIVWVAQHGVYMITLFLSPGDKFPEVLNVKEVHQ